MDLFSWRSPLLDGRREKPQTGAIRPEQDSGLAPSPTAPFGDLLDEQAAIPAARRPAAAMAASRLPLRVLLVNIDYPLGC